VQLVLPTRTASQSLRSRAVSGGSVPADELLALLAGRRGTGVRSRSLALPWHDVRTRALEMLYGLRASGLAVGAAVAFPGRLRPERLCAELGAIAGGYRIVADGAAADVTVVDDPRDAPGDDAGPGIVVVVDGTPTGTTIGLDRFAARGVAWAASHAAVPQPAALVSAAGMRTGDHVLLRAGCDRVVARAALVAAAFAGADLFVGELGMDAAVELDRTGAEVVATDVADVERIAALATAQRTTAARALRRIGRGPLGGRLRLILVEDAPPDEVRSELGRIGVEVATAV
jgi:hypothetical protein